MDRVYDASRAFGGGIRGHGRWKELSGDHHLLACLACVLSRSGVGAGGSCDGATCHTLEPALSTPTTCRATPYLEPAPQLRSTPKTKQRTRFELVKLRTSHQVNDWIFFLPQQSIHHGQLKLDRPVCTLTWYLGASYLHLWTSPGQAHRLCLL